MRHLLPAALGSIALAATALTAPAFATQSEDPEGKQLLLLLDASGSMADDDLSGISKEETAREALTTVVENLPDGANVGLRVFGATIKKSSDPKACQDTQLTVPIGTDTKADLAAAVKDYKPVGETPLAHAMTEAAKDLGDSGQRTILLISDGEDSCDPDPCETARKIAEKGIDLKVDVVGFQVEGKAQEDLQCIANASRGTYYDVGSSDDLVASLETLSARAFRGFSITGEPVEGAPIMDAAQTVKEGQYASRIGYGGDERYYQLAHTPGTTVHVSAAGRPKVLEDTPRIEVSLSRPDGSSCWVSDSSYQSQWNGVNAPVGATARIDANDENCGHSKNLVVKVTTNGGGSPKQELSDDAMPFELVIREEKPVTDLSGLTAAVEETVPVSEEWTEGLDGEDIIGGAGFSDAATIEPNTTYSGTLLPGEVQVFAVPLEYGQRMSALANAAPPSPNLKAGMEESGNDIGFGLAVFSPQRQGIDSTSSTIYTHTDARTVVTRDVAEVRWRNRENSSNSISPASLAGNYFIVVTASDIGQAGDALPFLVRADVDGEVAGEPAYGNAGDVQPPPPTEEPDAAADETETDASQTDAEADESAADDTDIAAGAEPDSSDAGGGVPMWVVPLVLVGLALAGGVGWFAGRSGRRTTP